MPFQTRFPTGDNTTVWTPNGAVSRFDCIDDPIGAADDATTFISRADSSASQRFTFSAFNVPANAKIIALRIKLRGRINPGPLSLAGQIQVGGVVHSATGQAGMAAYTDHAFEWLTNPQTSLPWTAADINGIGTQPLQLIGLTTGNHAVTEVAEVTQLYAEVEYTALRRRIIP